MVGPYSTREVPASLVVHVITTELAVILDICILDMVGAVVSTDVPPDVVKDLTIERADIFPASSVVLMAM